VVDKQYVVSSYSDLERIPEEAISIHLRKFVSKRFVEKILNRFRKLKEMSVSESVANRLSPKIMEVLVSKKIKVKISSNGYGRPSLMEWRR